ncbi:hypothetical protein [Limnohabitans sp. G3-2]|uniref:hypothetical protein n=1 Tax=Limnohabitans sp. G3-2 TaxID=1100711 RepID=UPI00117BABCC|nr:hypothetical protein [Limnohabitans sp. G3-2]
MRYLYDLLEIYWRLMMVTIRRSLVLGATCLLISACGGGGGASSTTAVPTGVAAVGAPISAGTLSAIDVNGRTASTTIANDGTYSIDFLSTLQAPVLLKAEGISGGRTTVHFGVVTSTTDQTINVTPVSTAIVSQVMQADPGAVFAATDTSKIALLTTSQVSATNTIIGNALSAARSAAGIIGNGALDFLNTPFSADKTGLDKLLDLVKISVQPDRSVQLKNKTSDGVTTVSSGGNVSGALGTIASLDTAGIDLLGRELQATFQTPSSWQNATASVLNLFSSSFLHGGENRSAIITSIAGDANDMVGAQFLPAKVLNCATTGSFPVCEVLFTVKYNDGGFEPFIFPVSLEGGSWKIYGDQAPVNTEYGAVVSRTVQGNDAPQTRSGFNITIYDDATIGNTVVGYAKAWFGTNTSGAPDFVFVNPLEVDGCNGISVGYLEVLTDPSNINSCAGNFAELSNLRIDQLRSTFATQRPKITVKYYDGSNNLIPNHDHVITVEALPLKPSEVTDGYFATITNASWSEFLAAGNNAPFTLVLNKGSSVGLEDVMGARPIGPPDEAQRLPFSTVRTGSSWRVRKIGSGSGSRINTVTRDADGRMYWYQRQP